MNESVEIEQYTSSPLPRNRRPDIRMASILMSQKYEDMQPIQKEAFLFIFVVIGLTNQWFNYDNLVNPDPEPIWIIVEWSVSAYFTWDTYLKRTKEFSMTHLLNFICGPLQFGMDVAYFVQEGRLYWLSIFLRSIKIISTNYMAHLIDDIWFSFIKTIPLLCASMLIYAIFTYVFTVFYSSLSKKYFGNVGLTALTLLQVLTFDGWGQLTRQLYEHSGIAIIAFMFLFITIMGFYFVFLVQAFQIDVLILEESIKRNQCDLDTRLQNTLRSAATRDLVKELLVDTYYKRIITVIGIIQLILANQQENLSASDDRTFALFNFVVASLYSLHFMLINLLDPQYVTSVYDTQLYIRIHMFCHLLAGPLALALLLYEQSQLHYIRFGPTLLLFKLFTNENMRDISLLSMRILPQCFAPYTCMLGLTFFTSFFMSNIHTKHLSGWIDGYGTAMLTYFQVITLDDWDAGLAKQLVHQAMYVECFCIVMFMVITNFILIPAFVAQSCEMFTIMLGTSFTPRLKEEQLEIIFFSHKFKTLNTEDQAFEIDHAKFTINQHVKAIIIKILQHRTALFSSLEYPNMLKHIYKLIMRRERTPRHKMQILNPKEALMCETMELIKSYDQSPNITISFRGQSVQIDEFNANFLKLNVKYNKEQ